MSKYRVIIEHINDDGEVDDRKEVVSQVEHCDESEALGIAIAGAMNGMCVWDWPDVMYVLRHVILALRHRSEDDLLPFYAVAQAHTHWNTLKNFNDVCAVSMMETALDEASAEIGKRQVIHFKVST